MGTIRTFIAVNVSSDVRGRAADLIRKLQPAGAKVSWVRPENMHLTLKFLGDIPDNETPDICRVVSEAVQRVPPFEFTLAGAGAFPSPQRARTLWIGVQDGLEHLRTLKSAIDDELKKALRFPRDRKDYLPHLTIGRVRESGPGVRAMAGILESYADFQASVTYVDEVTVYASFLESDGPTYQALTHAPLGPEA